MPSEMTREFNYTRIQDDRFDCENTQIHITSRTDWEISNTSNYSNLSTGDSAHSNVGVVHHEDVYYATHSSGFDSETQLLTIIRGIQHWQLDQRQRVQTWQRTRQCQVLKSTYITSSRIEQIPSILLYVYQTTKGSKQEHGCFSWHNLRTKG